MSNSNPNEPLPNTNLPNNNKQNKNMQKLEAKVDLLLASVQKIQNNQGTLDKNQSVLDKKLDMLRDGVVAIYKILQSAVEEPQQQTEINVPPNSNVNIQTPMNQTPPKINRQEIMGLVKQMNLDKMIPAQYQNQFVDDLCSIVETHGPNVVNNPQVFQQLMMKYMGVK